MSQQDVQNQFAIFHSFHLGEGPKSKYSMGIHVDELTWETMWSPLQCFAGDNLKARHQGRRLSPKEILTLEEMAGMPAQELIKDKDRAESVMLKMLTKQMFDEFFAGKTQGIQSRLLEKDVGETIDLMIDRDHKGRPIKLWVQRIA